MIEEYKKLKEFPKYRIYTDGRVYSEWVNKFLKPVSDKHGYLHVTLFKGKNKRKTIRLHVLLAKAFIYNSNPKLYNIVNHKDCNKCNNNISNLEWVNAKLNMQHASKYSYKNRELLSPLTKEMVLLIPSLLKAGMSIKLIASLYKVGHITIRNIIQRKTWKHLPLVFEEYKYNKNIIYISQDLYDILKSFNIDNIVLNSRIKVLESV